MATLQTNAKRSKIKSKNWFAPAISVALSVGTDPYIHPGPITDTPLVVLAMIIGQINPTAKNHNLPVLTSTQLIPLTRHNQHHLKRPSNGGSTSSVRKKHLCHLQFINHITHSHHKRRMPITFTDDDFHGVDQQ